MSRLVQRLRIAGLIALPFVLVGGWLAWKIDHQMHTPLPLVIIQGSR